MASSQSMVLLRLLLVSSWLTLVCSVRFQDEDVETLVTDSSLSNFRSGLWPFSSKPSEPVLEINNYDRISCLRQDNRDLVLPPSDFSDSVVRVVKPVQGSSTGRDIYLLVKKVEVTKIDMQIKFERKGDRLAFTVTGPADADTSFADAPAASIDVNLIGLDMKTPSTALDWAASWLTNREALKKGQDGKVSFKLSGYAAVVRNEMTKCFDLRLEDQISDTTAWDLTITNYHLISEALERFGGIDKLLLNNAIWPLVEMAVPRSLVASFHSVPETKLSADMTVKVNAVKQPVPDVDSPDVDSPLVINLEVTKARLDLDPIAVGKAFLEEFGLTTLDAIGGLAEARVDAMLSNPKLQAAFTKGRANLLKTMEYYQLGRGGEQFRNKVSKSNTLEELRPALVEIAKAKADMFLKLMTPLLQLGQKRTADDGQGATEEDPTFEHLALLDGLALGLKLGTHWDSQVNDGRISGSITPPLIDRGTGTSSGTDYIGIVETKWFKRFVMELEAPKVSEAADIKPIEDGGSQASTSIVDSAGDIFATIGVEQCVPASVACKITASTWLAYFGGDEEIDRPDDEETKRIQRWFANIDVDGDGFITVQEFQPWFQKHAHSMGVVGLFASGNLDYIVIPKDVIDLVATLPLTLPDWLGEKRSTQFLAEGVSLQGQELKVRRIEMRNVFYQYDTAASYEDLDTTDQHDESFEVAETQIWKLIGESSDFLFKIPNAEYLGFDLAVEDGRLKMSGATGDVSVASSATGLTFVQNPAAPPLGGGSFNAKVRKGVNLALDGEVPAPFKRPSQPAPPKDLLAILPAVAASTNVRVSAERGRLIVDVPSTIIATVDLTASIRSKMNAPSNIDYGYVFVADTFERRNGSASSEVTVLLNCGYLRIIDKSIVPGLTMSMDPGHLKVTKAQAEFDIQKQFKTKPLVQDYPGLVCLDLPPKGDMLCGSREKLERLASAIEMQLQRFADEKAASWNYGTHEHDQANYVIPQGEVALDIHESIGKEGAEVLESEVLESEKEIVFLESDAELEVVAQDFREALSTQNATSSKSVMEESAKTTTYTESSQRKGCLAQEDLDQNVYPPETFGSKSVRMVLADVPTVGAVHIVLGSIQITSVDMSISVKRTADKTFHLDINGSVLAWLEGLDFTTPSSSLGGLAQGFSNFENGFMSVITFGQVTDYGRLDQGSLDVSFKMSSDVTVVEGREGKAGFWEPVKTTVKHKAEVKYGSGGGIVLDKFNEKINDSTAKDAIFFDRLWPLVMALLPQSFGHAFQQVPFESGKMDHTLKIDGKCLRPGGPGNRQCRDDALKIGIQDLTETVMQPRRIIQDFMNASANDISETKKKYFQNILDAYENEKKVFKGAELESAGKLKIYPSPGGFELDLSGWASTHLPMPFLRSILGTETFLKFMPGDTARSILASGAIEISDGVVHIPAVKIENVVLPVSLSGVEESLELGLILGPFKAERIDEGRNRDCPNCPFSPSSPIKISAPEYRITINREGGVTAEFSKQESTVARSLGLHVKEGVLHPLFREKSKLMMMPSNPRKLHEHLPTGKVPKQFRRKHARTPSELSLARLLKKLELSWTIKRATQDELELQTEMARSQTTSLQDTVDSIENKATINVQATLQLGAPFWKGLLDKADTDYGFVHFAAVAAYGPLRSGTQLPEKKVIVNMGCGQLDVYSWTTTPYQESLLSEPVNLYEKSLLTGNLVVEGLHCIQLGGNYLCGKEIATLQAALELQKARFGKVPEELAKARAEGVSEGTLARAGSDGTWFKDYYVFDRSTHFPTHKLPKVASKVVSPAARWYHLTQTEM